MAQVKVSHEQKDPIPASTYLSFTLAVLALMDESNEPGAAGRKRSSSSVTEDGTPKHARVSSCELDQ